MGAGVKTKTPIEVSLRGKYFGTHVLSLYKSLTACSLTRTDRSLAKLLHYALCLFIIVLFWQRFPHFITCNQNTLCYTVIFIPPLTVPHRAMDFHDKPPLGA